MGLLSSVDPEWVTTVARAQLKDPFLGPLLRIGEQDRAKLTLQERSRLKQFTVLEGLLFYTPQQGGNPVTRLCVPASDNNAIRLTILFEAHDAYLHQGVDKTYRRLYAGYYWPTMTGDVQRFVNSCGSCQRMKSQIHTETGAISGHQVPD